MLEVQKFLKQYISEDLDFQVNALEYLKSDLGIKFTIWNDELVVLNYCQIESPKTHPITLECRSLVLELGTWEIVSRSFDRFFNYGEVDTTSDITGLVAHEKVDGSLIGIFSYKNETLYRTRSMIMPENEINGTAITWKEAIESCLPVDWKVPYSSNFLDTYICELTCRENRVVVKYDAAPVLTLLAVRENSTGLYADSEYVTQVVNRKGFNAPRVYTFKTWEEVTEAAKNLPDLEEGYVLYDSVTGVPIMKCKSPAYVAAHHLRGEGLNVKRILDLIIMNEFDEYLAIFPEDEDMFTPYVQAAVSLYDTLAAQQKQVHGTFVKHMAQKEFALMIKDEPTASILFNIRKGQTWTEAFDKLSQQRKRDLILKFMK